MRSRGWSASSAQRPQVISEHATGLDLFLDLEAMDDTGKEQARKAPHGSPVGDHRPAPACLIPAGRPERPINTAVTLCALRA